MAGPADGIGMGTTAAVWIRRLAACGAALVLVTSGGCFRLELSVELRADGSGVQRLRVRVDESVLDRAQRAAAVLATADGGPPDPTRIFDARAVAAELEDAGLTVQEHAVDTIGSERRTDVAAGFADLAQLRASPLGGGAAEWFVLPGRNPGGLRLVLYPQGHEAWREARERAAQLRAVPDDVRHEFFRAQRDRIAGLDVAFRIVLPGDVDYVSAGVEHVDARTVRLGFRAADLQSAEDVVMALAPRLEVEFDGRGVRWPQDAADPGVRPRAADRDR